MEITLESIAGLRFASEGEIELIKKYPDEIFNDHPHVNTNWLSKYFIVYVSDKFYKKIDEIFTSTGYDPEETPVTHIENNLYAFTHEAASVIMTWHAIKSFPRIFKNKFRQQLIIKTKYYGNVIIVNDVEINVERKEKENYIDAFYLCHVVL